VLGAGAGAGAAVAAVAVHAASGLAPASWQRAGSRLRWVGHAVAGAISAASIGPWLVLVLLACGALELAVRRGAVVALYPWPLLLAAVVAFAPSFSFILIGAERFDRLRANPTVQAFLDGAGPAAIGAIAGAALPLALALGETWQIAILAAAAIALFALRRSTVVTLVAAGAVGAVAAISGAPLPG
jgi:hypothetical protein